jgi:selenocysteine lyase/cysteine desulfurase
VNDSLDFVENIGFEEILAYEHTLCEWTANMLVDTWKTSLLVPLSMSASMISVRVPGTELNMAYMHDTLLYTYGIEVWMDGSIFLRKFRLDFMNSIQQCTLDYRVRFIILKRFVVLLW